MCIALLLAACSNADSESKESSSDVEEKIPELPQKVFTSNQINKTINESDMKKSVEKYLDTYSDLEKNASNIMNKENINKKDRNKLKEIIDLMNKNESNFFNYIHKNNLPIDYRKDSLEIYNYTKSAREVLNEIRDNTTKAMDEKNSNKVKLKSVDRLSKLNSKYKDKVNGKHQKEIEEFLKDKNIETHAFK